MAQQAVAIRAMMGSETRTETYMGREYTVVPVVALVEGVLQGANSDHPELALASEFGKYPSSWDGRPVVMNHPMVDGNYVSANSPEILESWSFGMIFNSRVEDGKLLMEAWIDNERAKELGGEFESTLNRLNAKETVEVSTGLFTSVISQTGKFNGRKYKGVWQGVVPDHLALLSEGAIGACSVEDGCGAMRANAANPWSPYVMCADKEDCGCGCNDEKKPVVLSGETQTQTQTQTSDGAEYQFEVNRFLANTIPGGLMDRDIRTLLQDALKTVTTPHSCTYAYVIGFTTDKFVYEIYVGGDYFTYQRSYSIGDDKTVTLGDDAERVILITQIVPKASAAGLSVNASEEVVSQENAMAGETTTSTEPKAPVVNTAPTFQELLSSAPAEMREAIEGGLRLHKQRKAEVISGLKASGRCKFSDEQLNSFDLETLENLSALANVPTYEAANPAPRANSAGSQEEAFTPAPANIFA